MKNIRYYACPSSVKDALALLNSRKYKAMALAGGTLVAKTLPDTVETYLDLKALPIKGIKLQGGNLVIGAGATFDEIDRSKVCRAWAGGIVAKAAAACSSQLVRNMATIGGNIARPHSFNIFPVVLLGLDAKVRAVSGKGSELLSLPELYAASPRLRPGANCLITEVVFPAAASKWKCEFVKLAKTDSSWESYITLFLAAEKRGGRVSKARVAVGALSPRPFLAAEAEKAILGAAGAGPAAFSAELEAVRAGEYRAAAGAALLGRFIASL